MNALEWTGLAEVIDWQTLSAQLTMTLLHFVWQGVVVGVILAVALRLLHQMSANGRYVVACCALASLPLIATFTFVAQRSSHAERSVAIAETLFDGDGDKSRTFSRTPLSPDGKGMSSKRALEVAAPKTGDVQPKEALIAVHDAAFGRATLASWLTAIERHSTVLSLTYCLGVVLMLARLLAAVARACSLRLGSAPIVVGELPSLVRKLAKEMGLRAAPAIACCQRVTVPSVVGLIQPTILLPPSMLTGLSTDELAAILSHELAHIRRFDLVVNLIQRVVESLLFFHPVVWWVSRRVSAERENCCDDLVVATGVSDVQYVESLLRMAELCLPSRDHKVGRQIAMMSAAGSRSSELSRRIERLLKIHAAPPVAASRWATLTAAITMTLIVMVTSLSVFGWQAHDDVKEVAKAKTKAMEGKENKEGKQKAVKEIDAGKPIETAGTIQWGDAVAGLRLGIRSASFAKRATSFRHGDWLRYELWVKNVSDQVIHVPGDPSVFYNPIHRNNTINLVGSISTVSFEIPDSAFDAALITIPPGEQKQLHISPQAPIREADAQRGRFGPPALTLAPGQYPIVASMDLRVLNGAAGDWRRQDGKNFKLRSANGVIQVLPAARLQFRRAYEASDASSNKSSSKVSRDASRQRISWKAGDGKMREIVINSDTEVILDEDDLLSFASFSDRNKPDYNLVVEVRASAIPRIARETRQLSKDAIPQPMLAILLDGKLLSVARVERPMTGRRAYIPVHCTESAAAALVSYLSESFVDCPCQTAWMKLPNEGFRIGARLDVMESDGSTFFAGRPAAEGSRGPGPLKMSFRLYNVSGKTKAVRVKLTNGKTVTETLEIGKPIVISEPVTLSSGDSQHGAFSMTSYSVLEGTVRQGWTVTQKIDGKVTMTKNIGSPIAELTVIADAKPQKAGDVKKPANADGDVNNGAPDSVDVPRDADTKIAVVLGKEIFWRNWNKNVSVKDNLIALILDPLKANYCREQKIDREEELKRRIPDKENREMAKYVLLLGEFNRHLYQKYGGRVTLSAFGPFALDAQKKWLADRETAGEFKILDQQLRADLDKFLSPDTTGVTFASPDQIKAVFDPAIIEGLIDKYAKMPAGGSRIQPKQIGVVLGKPIIVVQRQLEESDGRVEQLLHRLVIRPLEANHIKKHPELAATEQEIVALAAIKRKNSVRAAVAYRQSLAELLPKLAQADEGTDVHGNLTRLKQILEHKLKSLEEDDGRNAARVLVSKTKIQKHFYDNYGGGRVMRTHQAPIAVDAQREFLKECEKLGELKFTDSAVRTRFFKNLDHPNPNVRLGQEVIEDPVKASALVNPAWLR